MRESLRSNGKTVGSVEDRLSSAQDRLSEVNGSYSSALFPKDSRGSRFTRPRAVWYKLAVKGNAFTSPLPCQLSIDGVGENVLSISDGVVNGGNTIKLVDDLVVCPSAKLVR
jgi:hypothetical protein